MAHFTLTEANAWLTETKLSLTTLDNSLASQSALQVLPRLAGTFDTTSWTGDTNTPPLIRSIIAMYYVSWIYDRTYSDNTDDTTSNFAFLLRQRADLVIEGLIGGALTLPEDPEANASVGQPTFFPNDASSANEPSTDFPSDGPAAFMMGTVF